MRGTAAHIGRTWTMSAPGWHCFGRRSGNGVLEVDLLGTGLRRHHGELGGRDQVAHALSPVCSFGWGSGGSSSAPSLSGIVVPQGGASRLEDAAFLASTSTLMPYWAATRASSTATRHRGS